MAYQIIWHFQDPTKFENGWQLLWQGKWNQDEAIRIRKAHYKALVKALKPKMIADGRKAIKSNIYYYWSTPEYKEWMDKIDEINKHLKEDNDETCKYIELMKQTGEYWLEKPRSLEVSCEKLNK